MQNYAQWEQDKQLLTEEEKKAMSNMRALELKKIIGDYLEEREKIYTGFDLQEKIEANKKRLMAYFGADLNEWNNWHWQLARRISHSEVLAAVFNFSLSECEQINRVAQKYRWAVSPYYASLICEPDGNDPIKWQSIPSILELNNRGYDDPMAEEYTSPAPCITRRYPDRLIIKVTNQCGTFCRHCQRRRNFGERDYHQPVRQLKAAIEYVQNHPEIRDVLITGGDALMLSDNILEWLLKELSQIKHVEIKRIGTRAPVTLPQRITPQLCTILKKYPPIYLNTQFNHPREITPESKQACDMLVEAGVVLGNQAVLLKGINNNPHVMKKLNQELLKLRVRPYYLFHAKPVKGTCHFITTIEEGLAIIENLRGYTSGLGIPSYIINAPHGYGKVPILPQYLLAIKENKVSIRTWENRILEFSLIPDEEDRENFA